MTPTSPEPDPAARPPLARGAEPGAMLAAAAGGDRVALARLLSAVERGGERGRQVAALAYRSGAEAATVGITGAPGAGKSTLVDRLITAARADGSEIGVLAIDPTSPFTGGAILGDRVRMQDHALDPGVFIRSMATRGHLGGLAVAVPEAVRVLATVGLPIVLVETVGVGQVEVEVAAAADTVVVVVNPRWGDAVQANKAGLLEIADVFVINKADLPGAAETRRDLEQMLDLSAAAPGAWRPPIVETVAATGDGVDDLWAAIGRHQAEAAVDGTLARRRRERLERELRQVLAARIEDEIGRLTGGAEFASASLEVVEHRLDPYAAADRLIREVGRGT
ncbi:MAG TPA: methylmalonyl Co-A mutase-associated GTPase MeaB [Acidimicrobiales bacterium]|nr:methylmalonyl Co-A mutase-associated GTPase MeaB [Acidimicrobiales bacterium]